METACVSFEDNIITSQTHCPRHQEHTLSCEPWLSNCIFFEATYQKAPLTNYSPHLQSSKHLGRECDDP